ncbi:MULTISPECIES: phosphoribosyl-ATP pyrophosphatase [Deferrisoma]
MTSQAPTADILRRVYEVILDRKANPRPDSYVCRLLEKGEDKILQKVGEEAVEVLLAAKAADDDALVYELADLAFHCLVLLGHRGIDPARVGAELERRFGTSGLAEKAARGRTQS